MILSIDHEQPLALHKISRTRAETPFYNSFGLVLKSVQGTKRLGIVRIPATELHHRGVIALYRYHLFHLRKPQESRIFTDDSNMLPGSGPGSVMLLSTVSLRHLSRTAPTAPTFWSFFVCWISMKLTTFRSPIQDLNRHCCCSRSLDPRLISSRRSFLD